MKHKSLKAAALAAVLTMSMTATAMAAPGGGTQGGGMIPAPGSPEAQANGDTTISIFQTEGTTTNVSYEVPLYVTMAMANGSAEAKVPDNYTLINNTVDTTSHQKVPIGVTNMSFEKISDAANSFETVAWGTSIQATELTKLAMKIGGASIPAVSTKSTVNVPLAGSVFVDNQQRTAPITDTQNLKIETQIGNATTRQDAKTVASFRVKYTVSLMNASGQTLGDVYAGNDFTQAGLEKWDTTPTN